MLSRNVAVAAVSGLVLILVVALSGCATSGSGSKASAEFTRTGDRLAALIDAANYSAEDKETLKQGLSVALPSVVSNELNVAHVAQETVDIQIKNLHTNYPTALTLISNVAQCLEDQAKEFTDSRTFQRLPLADREEVLTYLSEAVEQYRARAYETLLKHKDRLVSVPADVSASPTNAQYRELLAMAVKMTQEVQPLLAEKHYTVKEGDSLALIARVHKVSTGAIIEANPGLNPIRMRVGQVIVVPPTGAKTSAASKAPSQG